LEQKTFEAYIAAYNAADWPAVSNFYTDDIRFESFGRSYLGADVISFLKQLHQLVRDEMVIDRLTVEDDYIHIEAQTRILALTDAPALPAGPMRAGEQRVVPMQVSYRTRGDRICAITVKATGQALPG